MHRPLADEIRPKTLDEVVGQRHLLAPGAYSLAYDSKLHYDLTMDQVTRILERQLDITPDQQIIEDTIDEHKPITGKDN